MAFTLTPTYGSGGSYTAQGDRILYAANASTSGVKKLTPPSAGVMTGDCAVVTSGTGNGSLNLLSGGVNLQWTVSTGQGLYYAYNDATITNAFTLTANSSGNPRYDLLSLVITDNGTSAPTVTPTVTTGTPAAVPTVPATPTNGTPLAYVLVPNGFTVSTTVLAANIFDLRQKGFLPDISTTSTSTTVIPSPTSGNIAFRVDEPQLVFYNGLAGGGAQWEGVPQFAGFRNVLYNGDFRVNQRYNNGGTRTYTAGAAASYGTDRWYASCTGASVTAASAAFTASPNYVFTSAGGVTSLLFGQKLPYQNTYYMSGKTVSLSAEVSSSVLTTITWSLYYQPSKTLIATGTWTITGTPTRYTAQIAVPSGVTTGLQLEFSTGSFGAGTLTFSRVQLEQGTAPTPFERRPFEIEYEMCRKFYQTSYVDGATAGSSGIPGATYTSLTSSTAGTLVFWVPFTSRLYWNQYSTATVNFWTGTGVSGQWNGLRTDGTNVPATLTANFISPHGVQVTASGMGLSTYYMMYGHWTVEAEL